MIATDDKNIGTSGDEFNDSTAKYVLGKLFAGKTERLTVFAIAKHEKIQEFIKMVLQLPG